MILKRVGVIGAGVVGAGIAHACIQHDMVLIGNHDDIFALAKDQINQKFYLNRLFNSPKNYDKTPNELISQITFTIDYQQRQDIDFALRNILH